MEEAIDGAGTAANRSCKCLQRRIDSRIPQDDVAEALEYGVLRDIDNARADAGGSVCRFKEYQGLYQPAHLGIRARAGGASRNQLSQQRWREEESWVPQ